MIGGQRFLNKKIYPFFLKKFMMLTRVAYVPNANPMNPIIAMAISLMNRGTQHRTVCRWGKRVSTSRQGGIMKARALQEKAPTRLMRSPRSGRVRATAAAERERERESPD